MDRRKTTMLIGVLMLASVSCGIIDTALNSALGAATGGNSGMTAVSQLWNDVPRMDSLTPSNADIPAPLKLVMRTVIGNLGLLNSPGEDRTTGNIDWVAFTTNKTPSDVQNYYTGARMAAVGWKASDQSACFSAGEKGIPMVGVVCPFMKEQGNKQTALVIIAAQESQTSPTNVFFLRLEETATPVPAKPK